MIHTLIISISAIILMFVCILKFPVLRIKNITIDTFFIPLLLAAILLICLPGFDKSAYFNSVLKGKVFVSLASESVCTKILAH